MRAVAITASASLVALSACGGPVHIEEANEHLLALGYTHLAETHVSIFRMSNNSAGRSKVLATALETCGLPKSTSAEQIRLTEGAGIYDIRMYSFSCPEQGKDAL